MNKFKKRSCSVERSIKDIDKAPRGGSRDAVASESMREQRVYMPREASVWFHVGDVCDGGKTLSGSSVAIL